MNPQPAKPQPVGFLQPAQPAQDQNRGQGLGTNRRQGRTPDPQIQYPDKQEIGRHMGPSRRQLIQHRALGVSQGPQDS